MRFFLSLFIVFFIFTGCSVKQVDTNTIANKESFVLKYARDIYFDDIDKKLVYDELSDVRPSSGVFKVLYFKDEVLVMSFDLEVIDTNQANMDRPINTIKRYSENGFKVGVQMLGNSGSNEPVVLLIPIITTIGGFTIGVIASSAEILEELKDSIVISKAEILNYYSIYNYDEKNVLKNIIKKVK
jgi:hypothetical protein